MLESLALVRVLTCSNIRQSGGQDPWNQLEGMHGDDRIQAQVKREIKLRSLNQHESFLTFVDLASINA